MQSEEIVLRPPNVEDGAAIWRLVRDTGILDLNSVYCYLLLCKDYAATGAVAEAGGEIAGFVTAYIPPGRGDTLFVWQVGVQAAQRGRGLASRLLQEILGREACHAVRFLETTISPSNQPSRALFAALAKRLSTELTEQPCFGEALFPDGHHEPEDLFRIGPFQIQLTYRGI